MILADGDGPGQRGAMTLADALQSVVSVRIISPPQGVKDARAWVVGGADGAVIDAAASSSPCIQWFMRCESWMRVERMEWDLIGSSRYRLTELRPLCFRSISS